MYSPHQLLVAGLLLATASLTEAPVSAAPRDTLPSAPQKKKPERPAEPPCSVNPNPEVFSNLSLGTSQEELVTAAWFARAVQLNDSQRAKSWNALKERPQRISDLYAGPFGLHATVLEFEDNVVVAYRGTQDPLDYVLNALIYTTPGWIHNLPGWVHKGFLTNFGLSWRRMRSLLRELSGSGKNIVFASHSLGGAMSQYAAWRLEQEGIRVGKIFAFQTPTAGDVKFKRAFDERFSGRAFNTLYGDDITPFIPPSRSSVGPFAKASVRALSGTLAAVARLANYATLEGRLEISADGELKPGQESSEDDFWNTYKLKSGGKAFPLGLGATSGFVKDHNIDLVLCSLARSKFASLR
ncbi:MAG: hypothetical protein RL189_45 [Pseudomonadota bacterium]|jgi:hypothetical protein